MAESKKCAEEESKTNSGGALAANEEIEARLRAAGIEFERDPTPLTGKAATQERILSAATELFLSRGYETTTVQQIAELASVSRATVFWHFSDKESLFRECFNRLCDPIRQSLSRDFSGLSPMKRLHQQVEIYESFTTENRGDVAALIRWAMERTQFRGWVVRSLIDLHQRFGGVLAETLAEIVPRDRDPYPIAMSVLMLLDGGLFLSYFDESDRWAEVRRVSVDAILEMIPQREAHESTDAPN